MGPLAGVRIIELAGIGPVPYAAMLLADLGADVIRIERPPGGGLHGLDRVNCRNRRSIGLDLKQAAGVAVALDLAASADVFVEGLRPGVAERLGIGPEPCLRRNLRLVYGRMTGWGQQGPNRDRAGHDINYIGISGALGSIGDRNGRPVVPLNLIGDLGGGALFLVMGVLAALVERDSSGRGQVIDAAMVDGSASLMTVFHEIKAHGLWEGQAGTNLLDGGAPFYDVYETKDGRWMSVGALEPKFFGLLLQRLDLAGFTVADQCDRSRWPELRLALETTFRARTRMEWEDVFRETDACVWPVLTMADAVGHPLNEARAVFTEVGGVVQPSPAPRFSRTAPEHPRAAGDPGADTESILADLGYDENKVARLYGTGAAFSQ